MTGVKIITYLLDFFSFLSLFGTLEVSNWVFQGIIILFTFHLFVKKKIPDQIAIVLFFLIIVVGFCGSYFKSYTPILVAAHTAPFAHCLLWFCRSTSNWRGWRIGIGLVEIVLSASLSPDFYIFFIIFAYFSLTTFVIFYQFFQDWLIKTGKKNPPINFNKYLASVCIISIVTSVIIGFLIFPFIPRAKTNFDGPSPSSSKTGYTESVSVTSWLKLTGQARGGTALRIFFPDEETLYLKDASAELATSIFLGLIRGRTLDRFDGENWKSDKKATSKRLINLKQEKRRTKFTLEIFRESLDTDIFPVPYGTRSLEYLIDNNSIHISPSNSLEWTEYSIVNQSAHYKITIPGSYDRIRPEDFAQDEPTDTHLEVPAQIKNSAFQKIAKRIFGNSKTLENKVSTLKEYFKLNHFRALGENEDVVADESEIPKKMSRLEYFFLVSKKGHCELFSTAYAMLLRLTGIPTRLVAGFRISHYPSGNTLIVKMGDAHAWIEYWDPDRGWEVIDPTPRLSYKGDNWLDYIADSYEAMSTIWYKYILLYQSIGQVASEFNKSKLIKQYSPIKIGSQLGRELLEKITKNFYLFFSIFLFGLLLIFLFLLLKFFFPLFSFTQGSTSVWVSHLNSERTLVEKWIFNQLKIKKKDLIHYKSFNDLQNKIDEKWGKKASNSFNQWVQTYLKYRFGMFEINYTEQISQLRTQFQDFKATLNSEKIKRP